MANNEEGTLQCYNRGCGQKFDSSKNSSDSCTHHPGVPVFHDAYKSWSCCDKKTTDFTDFLNIKGCTKSYHCNIKPPEPEKPKKIESSLGENQECLYEAHRMQKPIDPSERPSEDTSKVKLKSVIGSSLKVELEKRLKKSSVQEVEKQDMTSIQVGTPCKNSGCKQVFQGDHSDVDTCLYHSGVPIFHEGLKYWSCCMKKTTDFSSFLDQVGCATGKHLWIKLKSQEENIMPCRYDWHQTGGYVVLTIYSKFPIPDLSYIEANPVKLHMHIVFGEEKSVFDLELVLFGIVDVEQSNVNYLASKVEVKLKKARAMSWSHLALREEKKVKTVEHQEIEADTNEEVIDIDLDI